MLLANVRNLDFKEDYIFTCTVLLQKGQTKLLVYFEPIKLYLVHFLWHQTGFFFFFLGKFQGTEPSKLLCLFILTQSS